jgi:hypothetical protein
VIVIIHKIVFVALAVLLLIPCSASIPITEQPERQAVLAEQFAAFTEATGFDGIFLAEKTFKSRIQRIIGNFDDIKVTEAIPDTALLPVFEEIVSRIMPIIQSKVKPVFMSFTRDNASITAAYRQVVNGYDMGLRGSLTIKYYFGRQYFVTNDETYSFDTRFLEPSLTKDDAIRIWKENVTEEFRQSGDGSEPTANLAYYDTNISVFGDRSIKLCWLVTGKKYCLIDAVSGKVYITRLAPYGYTPL